MSWSNGLGQSLLPFRRTGLAVLIFPAGLAASLTGCSEPAAPPAAPSRETSHDFTAAPYALVRTAAGVEARRAVRPNDEWIFGSSSGAPLQSAVGPSGAALGDNLAATSPFRLVASVFEYPASLTQLNPLRLTPLCGTQTVTSQLALSDPPVSRLSSCTFSGGSANITARAGSIGGAQASLGSEVSVDVDGIVLDPRPGGVSRNVQAVYYDTVQMAGNTSPATVSLTFRLDGMLWNEFKPNSPNFAQADVAVAELLVIVPRPGCQSFAPACRAGALQVDWLTLTSMPNTSFEGTFLPTPGFTFGYRQETKIAGNVTVDIPVASAGPLPIWVVLAAGASAQNITNGGIAAYGSVHADFLNTAFLERVRVFDAQGNDITAQAAPTLASGIAMPGILKFPQAVVFNPAPPTSALIGSTLTLSGTGGLSGNPVTFSSKTPLVCTLTGSVLSLSAVGPCVVAADQAGNSAFQDAPQATATIAVTWPFSGFASPVANLPTVNTVNAGSAVAVKFALGGNRGLDILATGSPTSAPASCTGTDVGPASSTASPGASSISFDATTGLYTYAWKTDKAWSGTCRRLQVTLRDGTIYAALFRFN